MPEFVMLSRVDNGTAPAAGVTDAEPEPVRDKIRSVCPTVRWVFNRRFPGAYDYLDVFTAPGPAEAVAVARAARRIGKAQVELWAAEEWRAFNALVGEFG